MGFNNKRTSGKKYAILARSHVIHGKFERIADNIEAATPLEAVWVCAQRIQKRSWDQTPDFMRPTTWRPVIMYQDRDGSICMKYQGRPYEIEVEEC